MFPALLIVARSVQIGSSLLFAGIFAFEVVALGPTDPHAGNDRYEFDRRLLRLSLCTLFAALVSAFPWFYLVVADMGGLTLVQAFSGEGWQTVLFKTDFGRVWQLRLGLIVTALALVGLGLAGKKWLSRVKLALFPLAFGLLVSLGWVSHAAAAGRQALGLLGDALHLCAAGAWMGGLLPLVIFLAHAKVSVSLGERAPDVLRRFSALSLGCVSVLVVSGLSNSWLLVGSIGALFTTPYGLLLLLKLTLFGVLLVLGTWNRLMIKAGRRSEASRSDLFSQLRRNVICEICLGLAVVAIVGWLGITPPARSGTAFERRSAETP
jgi:putative copper resistance protein D